MKKNRLFFILICAAVSLFLFFPGIGGFEIRGISDIDLRVAVLIMYAAPALLCGLLGSFMLGALKNGAGRTRSLFKTFLFSVLVYGGVRALVQFLGLASFLLILHPHPFFELLLDILSFPGNMLNKLVLDNLLGPAVWLRGPDSIANQLRLWLLLAVSLLCWGVIGTLPGLMRRLFNDSPRLKYLAPCAVPAFIVFIETYCGFQGLAWPAAWLAGVIFAVLGGMAGSFVIYELQKPGRAALLRGFLAGVLVCGGILAQLSGLELALFYLLGCWTDLIDEVLIPMILLPGILFDIYVLNPLAGPPRVVEGFGSMANELRSWLLLLITLLSWGAAGAVLSALYRYIREGPAGVFRR